uniref:Uncharacterized protein n=1 Tax=Aegilops tauschii subsp. strangulata TaxID=200361 RepID=A0A453ICX3_AEGTS
MNILQNQIPSAFQFGCLSLTELPQWRQMVRRPF